MSLQTGASRQSFSGVVVAVGGGWVHVKNAGMRRVVSVFKPEMRLGDRVHATGELARQPMLSPESLGRYVVDPAERGLWEHYIASSVHVTDCRPAPTLEEIAAESTPATASASARPRAAELAAGLKLRNPRNQSVVELTEPVVKGGRPAWKIRYTYITGRSRQHKSLLVDTILSGYVRMA